MILKLRHNIPLEDVLYRIEYAEETEIDAMIHAIRNRYSRLFPGWEVMFVSIQAGSKAQRRQQVELLIETLRRQYLQ